VYQFVNWYFLCALPCYAAAINARGHVPTSVFLSERLQVQAGAKDRFGATAAEVLETAALIAAADQDWDQASVAAFQKEQDIHPKVWGKLIAIHKDQRLHRLKDKLPASYTALYALVVMSDEEFSAAVAEGLLIRAKGQTPLSSRAILDWTKAYRLKGTGIEQEIPLTLVLKQDLIDEQHQDLLQALKRVAEQFGAEVREGKRGLRQAEVKAEARKAVAEEIEEALIKEIAQVVVEAPEDLKSRFGISSAGDLIGAPRGTFTGFFQNLVGKVKIEFWKQFGRAYLLKMARDFNLTDSRTERFQLKKRILEDFQPTWSPEICEFEELCDEIVTTYMQK